MQLQVYLNTYQQRHFVGLLDDKNSADIYFEYNPDFLAENIQLSPFQLPLKRGVFYDEKHTFMGLYGLFNDSLPDGWGCLLLDRSLQKKGLSARQITPLNRLAYVGNQAMGALEYAPMIDKGADDMPPIMLDILAQESKNVLQGNTSLILEQLLTLNGSSAGARPKILALVSTDKKNIIYGQEGADGFDPWIIKFAAANDDKNIGVQEYVYAKMAKEAGIDMPETHLFESQHHAGHFGVKRFDRMEKNKIHIHTACGLLHASHRYASLDYTSLLKLTSILTKDIRQVEKMFRLMVFNVKSGNKDDHSKNFAFMLDEKYQWKMAPAYDLTPSQGINGEQTTMVNGKGLDITNDDFIKTGQIFGLSHPKMLEIIQQIDDVVAQYPKKMKMYL